MLTSTVTSWMSPRPYQRCVHGHGPHAMHTSPMHVSFGSVWGEGVGCLKSDEVWVGSRFPSTCKLPTFHCLDVLDRTTFSRRIMIHITPYYVGMYIVSSCIEVLYKTLLLRGLARAPMGGLEGNPGIRWSSSHPPELLCNDM
jgi:hypothetical protein